MNVRALITTLPLPRRLFKSLWFRWRDNATVLSADVAMRSRIGDGTLVRELAVVAGSVMGPGGYVNRGAEVYRADIGPYVSLGQYCQIGANEHLLHCPTMSETLYPDAMLAVIDERNTARTVLGADVWVGSRAVILKGRRIGTGAVVAAGAVVTRDVAPYAIVAGVPARVVGARFNDDTIGRLLASRWWLRPRREVESALARIGTADPDSVTAVERFLDGLGAAVDG